MKLKQPIYSLLGYLALVSVWRFKWDWGLLGFWIGGLLGYGVEVVDRLVYIYWTRPDDQLSWYGRHLMKERKWRELGKVLKSRGEEQRFLVSRSVLFMATWIVLALYLVTSSGSMLAVGAVMGCGWRLITVVLMHSKDKEELKSVLFWQIKRKVTDRELKIVLLGFSLVFTGLTWLLRLLMWVECLFTLMA